MCTQLQFINVIPLMKCREETEYVLKDDGEEEEAGSMLRTWFEFPVRKMF